MAANVIIKSQFSKPVKIIKWKVSVGNTVYDGRVILLYEEDTDKVVKLKSKHVGTVAKLLANEGDTVNVGDGLLELSAGCRHPTVINDLCAECGADLQREGLESNATVPMVHSIPQLKVSHEEAQELGKADTERLLRDRKLVLLVDLDQTLIHTTHDNIPNNLKDVHHFQLGGNAWYHTRLRPGTHHFLSEMNSYFELHICTFGVRPYAHTVAHILDSQGALFSHRILSRDECFDYNSKVANLKALFPCGEQLVCIIDDRADVWNYSPNLVPVKPYHFFQNTGDINDPNLPPQAKHSDFFAKGVKVKMREKSNGDQATEEGTASDVLDVEDEDDYLLYLESILKSVHKMFYDIYDKKEEGKPEVSWVLSELRGRVLKGCNIVFSGLVPLSEGLEHSEPYLMAKSLGAEISNEVSETTTHVIAAAEGTMKVRQACNYPQVKVVNPQWLNTCLYRWEKVDERLYPLGGSGEGRGRTRSPHVQPVRLSADELHCMAMEVDAEVTDDEYSHSSTSSHDEKDEDLELFAAEINKDLMDDRSEDKEEDCETIVENDASKVSSSEEGKEMILEESKLEDRKLEENNLEDNKQEDNKQEDIKLEDSKQKNNKQEDNKQEDNKPEDKCENSMQEKEAVIENPNEKGSEQEADLLGNDTKLSPMATAKPAEGIAGKEDDLPNEKKLDLPSITDLSEQKSPDALVDSLVKQRPKKRKLEHQEKEPGQQASDKTDNDLSKNALAGPDNIGGIVVPEVSKKGILKHSSHVKKNSSLSNYHIPKLKNHPSKQNDIISVVKSKPFSNEKQLTPNLFETKKKKKKKVSWSPNISDATTVPLPETNAPLPLDQISSKEKGELRDSQLAKRKEQIEFFKLNQLQGAERRSKEEHDLRISQMKEEHKIRMKMSEEAWHSKRQRHLLKLDILRMEVELKSRELERSMQPKT